MGRLVGASVASAAEFYASTILASARSLWSSSSSSRKRLQIAAGNRYLYSLLPDIPRSGNMGSCSGGSRSFACYISVLEPRISQYRFVCCVVVVVVVVSLLILCALCLRVSVFLLVIFVSLCVLKIWRSMRFFVFPPHSCTPASIERNNILEPPRSRCLSSAFGDFLKKNWWCANCKAGSEVCNLEDVLDVPSSGVVAVDSCNKLRLFSGNDYLGLSVHPAVRSAAAEV
jgi:hypothetical protein